MVGKIHFDLHEDETVTLSFQFGQEPTTVLRSDTHQPIIHDLLLSLAEACQRIAKNKDLYF